MDLLPASDYWWRYFIYGALFHFAAITPLCKTEQWAGMFRFGGTALAVIPVFMREGFVSALVLAACLYGWTLALKFFKSHLT